MFHIDPACSISEYVAFGTSRCTLNATEHYELELPRRWATTTQAVGRGRDHRS